MATGPFLPAVRSSYTLDHLVRGDRASYVGRPSYEMEFSSFGAVCVAGGLSRYAICDLL